MVDSSILFKALGIELIFMIGLLISMLDYRSKRLQVTLTNMFYGTVYITLFTAMLCLIVA